MNAEYIFAKNFLGPVFAKYCYENWIHLSSFSEDETVALFASRGGLRLRYLYELFCRRLDKPSPIKTCDFMISRLASYKVCLHKSPEVSEELLKAEMSDKSLYDVVTYLGGNSLEIRGERNLKELLEGKSVLKDQLAQICEEQYEYFREYLESITMGARNLIICDTGLYGSTQRTLMAAFPSYNWFGLYFARSNYRKINADHFTNVIGLMSERDVYHPFHFESVFLRYWHLVEDVLEPRSSSVKSYVRNAAGKIQESPRFDFSSVPPAPTDNFFQGIYDYIDELDAKDWLKIDPQYSKIIRKLRFKITHPTDEDVDSMCVGARSRDMGSNEVTSILRSKVKGFSRKLQNINISLWKEGQCRIEFGVFAPIFLWGFEIHTILSGIIRKLRRNF